MRARDTSFDMGESKAREQIDINVQGEIVEEGWYQETPESQRMWRVLAALERFENLPPAVFEVRIPEEVMAQLTRYEIKEMVSESAARDIIEGMGLAKKYGVFFRAWDAKDEAAEAEPRCVFCGDIVNRRQGYSAIRQAVRLDSGIVQPGNTVVWMHHICGRAGQSKGAPATLTDLKTQPRVPLEERAKNLAELAATKSAEMEANCGPDWLQHMIASELRAVYADGEQKGYRRRTDESETDSDRGAKWWSEVFARACVNPPLAGEPLSGMRLVVSTQMPDGTLKPLPIRGSSPPTSANNVKIWINGWTIEVPGEPLSYTDVVRLAGMFGHPSITWHVKNGTGGLSDGIMTPSSAMRIVPVEGLVFNVVHTGDA